MKGNIIPAWFIVSISVWVISTTTALIADKRQHRLNKQKIEHSDSTKVK